VPPSRQGVAGHPGSGHAFDEDLGGTVRQAGALEDAGYDPDPVQVARSGVLDLSATLGDHQDELVLPGATGRFGRIESRQRGGTAHEQRHHDIREDHDLAQREHREAVRSDELLGVAGEEGH
jgi:hypothetical protein